MKSLDKLINQKTYGTAIERLIDIYNEQASRMLEAIETVLCMALTNLDGLENVSFERDEGHTPLNWLNVSTETADKITNKVRNMIQTPKGFAELRLQELVAWYKPIDREELGLEGNSGYTTTIRQ